MVCLFCVWALFGVCLDANILHDISFILLLKHCMVSKSYWEVVEFCDRNWSDRDAEKATG